MDAAAIKRVSYIEESNEQSTITFNNAIKNSSDITTDTRSNKLDKLIDSYDRKSHNAIIVRYKND
jgi:hypothetical protein